MATTWISTRLEKVIVFIDVSRYGYSEKVSEHAIYSILTEIPCPACGRRGAFRPHGRYLKYYYEQRIVILRVRCRCRRTHAVIPSFSLPGSSIGMAEAEAYLKKRKAGDTRREAGHVFPEGFDWMRRGRRLERRFRERISVGKALLPAASRDLLWSFLWLSALTGVHAQVLFTANQKVQDAGVGALFFSRTDRIMFSRTSSGTRVSPKMESGGSPGALLDSS